LKDPERYCISDPQNIVLSNENQNQLNDNVEYLIHSKKTLCPELKNLEQGKKYTDNRHPLDHADALMILCHAKDVSHHCRMKKNKWNQNNHKPKRNDHRN